jgi:hypothetical protein
MHVSTMLLGLALAAPAIPVQGHMTDGAGRPLTGVHQVTFALYEHETGGPELWEGQRTVDFVDGGFAALLSGGVLDDPATFAAELEGGDGLFIEVQVPGSPASGRVSVGVAPLALLAWRASEATRAAEADTLVGGFGPSSFLPWDWLPSFSDLGGSPRDNASLAAALDEAVTHAQLPLGGSAPAIGQVMTWDGSAWVPGDPPASGAGTTCPSGQVVSGVQSDGTLMCTDVFAGLPDADNDSIPDVLDTDDDNDLVLDDNDSAPANPAIPGAPSAIDGTSTDKTFAYSSVTPGQGTLTFTWDARTGAARYRVSIGTTAGGADVLAPTDVTGTNTYTATGLTLQGAWVAPVKTYYGKIEYMNAAGVPVYTVITNGARIAEAVTWDGVNTASLRQGTDAGWTTNFPSGNSLVHLWGAHYFETVDIASGVTVSVQPFGRADSVPAGISPSDARVTSPKDGWLGLHANTISVAGVIDGRGRGYGGGAGAGAGNSGLGGSSGLSGNGGTWSGAAGGAGRAGGGGGAGGCSGPLAGGAGGINGGGGGGASYDPGGAGAAASSNGDGGAGGGTNGGPGGTGYQGGKASVLISGRANHLGGGGGGGWGGGGGGGGCNGTGGGGGGTGGFPSSQFTMDNVANTTGAGPAAGAGGGAGGGGRSGGYNAASTNTDASTDLSFRIGSGGGGGGTTGGAEGGGGGGAGGGAIRLMASQSLTITGQVLAGGGSGGAGNTRTTGDADNGGGGGGGGGGVVLSAPQLAVSGTVRTLGGGHGYFVACPGAQTCSGTDRGGQGGDGDSQTANGGTIKLFYGSFTGTRPAASQAGRVFDAGANSAATP